MTNISFLVWGPEKNRDFVTLLSQFFSQKTGHFVTHIVERYFRDLTAPASRTDADLERSNVSLRLKERKKNYGFRQTECRCNDHTLMIETGRHKKMDLEERMCKVCSQKTVEDDFFLECPACNKVQKSLLKHVNPNEDDLKKPIYSVDG